MSPVGTQDPSDHGEPQGQETEWTGHWVCRCQPTAPSLKHSFRRETARPLRHRFFQTVNSHLDFSEAAVQECKTGAAAPDWSSLMSLTQADTCCFLRRAINPSRPKPASIMA